MATKKDPSRGGSLRRTPDEIVEMLEIGAPELWQDLFEDFRFSGDLEKDQEILASCAMFLKEKFPEQMYWGSRDFDILIAHKLIGRYSNMEEAGFIRANDDKTSGTITEDVYNDYAREGWFHTYVEDKPGAHLYEMSEDEVLVFEGIHSVRDVLRD